MREPKKGEKVSGFQAMTAALGNTLGPGNIAGTPVAIALGGPGGLFWMFIVGLISSGTKFCEVTLAMKYRTKDPNGEYLGGAGAVFEQVLQEALAWDVLLLCPYYWNVLPFDVSV